MSKTLHDRIKERNNPSLSIEPPFPTKNMSIEISNYCNHSCIFCWRNKLGDLKGFIDQALYKRIMQEAYDEGMREAGLFINGEPFTHPKLDELIGIAKKIGYEYIYLTTNGSLANPEQLRKSINAGLDSIKFSVNAATRESYIKVHGRDDFDKVIENVKYAAKYRKESGHKYNIFGSFIITTLTISEVDLFKENYVPLFDDFAFYNVRGKGIFREDEVLSVNGFIPHKHCPSPFNSLNIDSAGILSYCDTPGTAVADLNEMSLRQAWHSDAMKQVRQAHIDNKLFGTICETCLAGGGGVVEAVEL